MQMPVPKNHPIENVLRLKYKLLSDLMPFLEFDRKLEKDPGENSVLWVVVNGSEPDKRKMIFPKPLGLVWVSETKLGREDGPVPLLH